MTWRLGHAWRNDPTLYKSNSTPHTQVHRVNRLAAELGHALGVTTEDVDKDKAGQSLEKVGVVSFVLVGAPVSQLWTPEAASKVWRLSQTGHET